MRQQDTLSSKTASSATSRFSKGKRRDALDEIEGWISDSRSEFGRGKSTRVSAQPPKNVTEQKMLDAKLFEMSKQRYNFILHAKWQQKLFMEKQRQKTAVMKDLLKNVDLGKINKRMVGAMRRENMTHTSSGRADYPSNNSQIDALRYEEELVASFPETLIVGREHLQKKNVTFITERANIVRELPQLASASETVIEAVKSVNLPITLPPIEGNEQSKLTEFSDTDSKRLQAYILPLEGRWPVKDLRFVKLRDALSDNYPGRRRRELSSSTMSFA